MSGKDNCTCHSYFGTSKATRGRSSGLLGMSKPANRLDSVHEERKTDIFDWLDYGPNKDIRSFIAAITIDHWIGFLGFIQTEFAHVPQYSAFFIAGIVGYHQNWLATMRAEIGRIWLAIGVALAAFFYSGIMQVYSQGGLSWDSFAYSTYETLMCTGLNIGLIYLFREAADVNSRLLQKLSDCAFTVYILHVPVVVLLQYVLEHVTSSAVAKYWWVTIWGILLTFYN